VAVSVVVILDLLQPSQPIILLIIVPLVVRSFLVIHQLEEFLLASLNRHLQRIKILYFRISKQQLLGTRIDSYPITALFQILINVNQNVFTINLKGIWVDRITSR
jgi:hypothetical protein